MNGKHFLFGESHTFVFTSHKRKSCLRHQNMSHLACIFCGSVLGFVSPKLHVSTYRNQQHCWWFQYLVLAAVSPLLSWIYCNLALNHRHRLSYAIIFSTCHHLSVTWILNTLRPTQNCRHFADDIFKYIFLNDNVWISLKISLIFVLRLKLPILQHRFRSWLGTDQATSHYLNQFWLVYWCMYVSFSLNELNKSYLILKLKWWFS